jgi:hypothetical protein
MMIMLPCSHSRQSIPMFWFVGNPKITILFLQLRFFMYSPLQSSYLDDNRLWNEQIKSTVYMQPYFQDPLIPSLFLSSHITEMLLLSSYYLRPCYITIPSLCVMYHPPQSMSTIPLMEFLQVHIHMHLRHLQGLKINELKGTSLLFETRSIMMPGLSCKVNGWVTNLDCSAGQWLRCLQSCTFPAVILLQGTSSLTVHLLLFLLLLLLLLLLDCNNRCCRCGHHHLQGLSLLARSVLKHQATVYHRHSKLNHVTLSCWPLGIMKLVRKHIEQWFCEDSKVIRIQDSFFNC